MPLSDVVVKKELSEAEMSALQLMLEGALLCNDSALNVAQDEATGALNLDDNCGQTPTRHQLDCCTGGAPLCVCSCQGLHKWFFFRGHIPELLVPFSLVATKVVCCCMLCAGKTVYKPMGAPTEVSLLTLGQKAGLTQQQLQTSKPRIASIPFESEHKVRARAEQPLQPLV